MLPFETLLDDRAKALIQKLNQAERDRKHSLQPQAYRDAERRRRVEITRGELWGQPAAIETTLREERAAIADAAARLGAQPLKRIYLAGCGDSLGAAIAVRDLYERLLSIPCETMQALDFAYYYHRPVDADTLVIVLSSSGVTARVLEALLLSRALGARTLALSNTRGSPVMNEAHEALYIHATRKGWPTQSTTAAMAVLYQFVLDLARHRGVEPEKVSALEQELAATPKQIQAAIERHAPAVQAVAEREASRQIYLYAGGGPAYACALFGAAKLKECTERHAVAIPLEEYHHYVSQREGDPLFLIAPSGPSIPRAIDTAQSGRAWGGTVYGITTENDPRLKEYVDAVFGLPAMSEFLAPMVYSIPVQLFAYYVAMAQFQAADAGTT